MLLLQVVLGDGDVLECRKIFFKIESTIFHFVASSVRVVVVVVAVLEWRDVEASAARFARLKRHLSDKKLNVNLTLIFPLAFAVSTHLWQYQA